MKFVIALYSVSSVQRLLDFIKTVYAFNDATPVIIKPIGAAAQIGVPEAHKLAYKLGKPLIVLPEIQDLVEIVKVEKLYLLTPRGRSINIEELSNVSGDSSIAIVVNGGDTDFTRQELQYGEGIWVKEVPTNLPPQSIVALLLYIIRKYFRVK